MNAIELLKQQHETTKEGLEKACNGDASADELRLMADELIAHMVIEEHVFYPRIRELKKDLVREAFEEHAVARFELARAMGAKGEQQKMHATVLKELVEHHIEEEEMELFPKVTRAIPMQELEALGLKMEEMFDRAVEAGLEKLVVGGVNLRAMQSNGTRARARPTATKSKTARARAGAKGGRAKAAKSRSRGSRSRASAR